MIFGNLVGHLCKPEKSVDTALAMVLLDARAGSCLAKQSAYVSIDAVKADGWSQLLLSDLESRRCEQELATMLAGHLTFAVTVSIGKVGASVHQALLCQGKQSTAR